MDADFIINLEKALRNTLPGERAQKKMAPRVGRSFRAANDAGNAGVLLLLFPRKGDLHLLLMKRTEYPGPHSRQISLPGGKSEEADEDFIYTALRETAEETGVDAGGVTVLGTLTPLYIPVSNLMVHPVVGYTDRQPRFTIDPQEVEYLVPVSLRDLEGGRLQAEKELVVSGISIRAPGYIVGDDFIWGATAMILAEFLEVAGQARTDGRQ